MQAIKSLLVLLLAIVGAAVSQQWALEGAKLTVSTVDGSSRIAESFTTTTPPSVESPLELNADEVLRLAFTLQGSGGEKLGSDELPHQVVVSLTDVQDPFCTTSSIVSVKRSTGKASWSQRLDRLPGALAKGSGVLQATLVIASFGDAAPIKLPIMTFKVPASLQDSKTAATARERLEMQQGFQRRIERRHTFAIPAAEQMPPKIVSLAATAVTLLVPSAIFAVLLSMILPSLSIRAPSKATAPLLASLLSLESLALLYWNGGGFTLFKMMPWLLVLGAISLFVGKTALTEMQRVRVGKQA